MLRRFAGPRRNTNEDYVTWIIRATGEAEHARDSSCVKSWMEAVLAKKWSWAGHVARMDSNRWALRLSNWRNHEWWQGQDQRTTAIRPIRARAGYQSRWENELAKFAERVGWNLWSSKARTMTTPAWNEHCSAFANFAAKSLRRRVD